MKAVYAIVENVRPVPSRGISVIQLEVPIEDHVAITELLFGQTALLTPYELKDVPRYGLVDTERPQPAVDRADAPLVKLAGQWCRLPAFWEFLSETFREEVCNEEDAASLVREVCGVESRADIAEHTASGKAFHERLRVPYIEWQGHRL